MQREVSRTTIPAVPILILVPASVASPHPPYVAPAYADQKVLGLGLVQRTVMAARRAGYGQIFLLARDHATPPGIAADFQLEPFLPLPSCSRRLRRSSLRLQQSSLKPIGSNGWPRRGLNRLPGRRSQTGSSCSLPTAVPDALAVLHAEGGAYDLAAVQDRLTRRFGPPAAIPAGIDPMVVVTSMDVSVAERRLLRSLVKDTDGFMARHVERPISLQIVRRLAATAITPNQITMVSVAIGLFGAPFFYPRSGPGRLSGRCCSSHIRSSMDATENWLG